MKKQFATLLAPVQEILCKHGIDPFACREVDNALKGRNMVIAQNWCHTEAYARATKQEIEDADRRGPQAVKDKLLDLARRFASCEFNTPRQAMAATAMVDDMTDE